MNQTILVWLLFESDGEVLVARRPEDGGAFAGQWTLPGGVMPEDESDEETLQRFARDDLSVTITGEEFEETLYITEGSRNLVTNVFRVTGFEGDLRFRKGAYDDARWVEPAELQQADAYPMPSDLRDLLAGAPERKPAGVPDNKASWDAISAMYQTKHKLKTDTAHYGPRMPTENELRLLGDVHGKRILEIGCGGGQCAIAFAKQGAIVTAIDQSVMQLNYAQGLAEEEGARVEFVESDISALPQVKSASQDAVFSAYALGYVEDIGGCLAEVARVLKPGGAFVFSVDHPAWAMTWGGAGALQFGRPYWDTYKEWEWGDGSGIWMRSWTRTVGEWVGLLRDASLAIDALLEPKMVLDAHDPTWDDSYPYEKGVLVPTTLIIRALKA